MGLRTSASVTIPIWHSKQFWLVARLFQPVFTAIIHLVLSKALPDAVSSVDQRGGSQMRSLQALYDYATYVAVVPHMANHVRTRAFTNRPDNFLSKVHSII
jgi:hypothetical protein